MLSAPHILSFLVSSFCVMGTQGESSMNKVISLIQQSSVSHSEQVQQILDKLQRVGSDITPQAKESMDEVLENLTALMSTNVLEKIRLAHDATQRDLGTKELLVRDSASAVTGGKTAADEADNLWYNCVAEQQGLATLYEYSLVTIAVAEHNMVEPCGRQENLTQFTMSEQNKDFSCSYDAEDDSLCSTQIQIRKDEANATVQLFTDEMDKQRTLYQQAEQDCQAAKVLLEEAKENSSLALQDLTQHAGRCQTLELDRKMKICEYGSKLETLCEAYQGHKEFSGNIELPGTVESQDDRKDEWAATKKLLCLFDAILKSGDLTTVNESSVTLQDCKFNYEDDVGKISHESGISEGAEDAYHCDNVPNVKFGRRGGLIWKVENVSDPDTYDNTTVDEFQVDLEENFVFCRVEV